MVKRKQKKGEVVVEEKITIRETVNIENDPLTSSDDEQITVTETITVKETLPVTIKAVPAQAPVVVEEVKASDSGYPKVLKRAFHMSTKLYPNNFFYMKKAEGKGLGVDGAPGDKGEFIFAEQQDGTYLLSTKLQPNHYVYMKSDKQGFIGHME